MKKCHLTVILPFAKKTKLQNRRETSQLRVNNLCSKERGSCLKYGIGIGTMQQNAAISGFQTAAGACL